MYFSPFKFMDPLVLPTDSLKVTGPQIKNPDVYLFGGHHLGNDCWLS